jgi:hypothetical protein
MADLERLFEEIARKHGDLTEKQVRYAIREIGRIRGDIADLLADFESGDGTIKRQRLMRLLRELEQIEKSMQIYGMDALIKVIEESADFAITEENSALVALIGLPLIKRNQRASVRDEVTKLVIKRKGDDGLALADRIWNMSGIIRDSIATQIRSDVIKGVSVGTMVRNVRKIYDGETWMIKRLVVTELNTAYRTATAKSIERSEVADWLRIVDNGFRHPHHKEHRCYELAQEDRYGQGKGVFKPTDTEIYSPHPQCSSFLIPVLKSEYL